MEVPDIVNVLLTSVHSNTQLQPGTQAAGSNIRRLVLDHGEAAVLRDLQRNFQNASPAACKALRVILTALRGSAVVQNSGEDAITCNQLRSQLFSKFPSWLQSIAGDEHHLAVDVVTTVMPDVQFLQQDDVAALMTSALTAMEQKLPHACTLLELLPPCLAALQAAASIPTGTQAAASDAALASQQAAAEADAQAEAVKHRDAAIHRLQHCQWQPEQVCRILTVIKSMAVTPEQLRSLLMKAIRACRSAGLQQVPPILYQVLLLSGAAPGMRCFALKLIISLFDVLEDQHGHNDAVPDAPLDEHGQQTREQQQQQQQQQQPLRQRHNTLPSATLMQVQATLLMHISTMLRYDAALGNEWVKWAANEAGNTNYFLLQVLLTMSRQPKHEQAVLQLLKKKIMRACEQETDATTSNSSHTSSSSSTRNPGAVLGGCTGWMSGLPQVNRCAVVKELEDGLMKAVRCSSYASELVAPGLLQLSDILLTTRCSSPLHVVLAVKQQVGACSLPPQAPASARAVVLGLQVLQGVFAAHAEARGEVMKLLQDKLASHDLGAALPIVLLLGRISQQQPALLSEHLPQLKECLGSFPGLSTDTAMALLLAVWPLCRVRPDLQDFVTMLLRKMMYRQDVDGRLIATRGFLLLICQHLHDAPLPQPTIDLSAASCSQASLSQRASLSSSKDVNLVQELTGVLRRALSQQAPVREALYEGILQIYAADPSSQELLAELLLPQLKTYINRHDDAQQSPPFMLHKCAELQHDDAVLLEPLPALLRCVHHLTASPQQRVSAAALRKAPTGSLGGSENFTGNDRAADDQAEESSVAALKACFDAIRAGLGRCQLDHFEIPTVADLSPQHPEGRLGQLHAANLLGSLQVAVEVVVSDVQRMLRAQPDTNQQDGAQVNKLGAELLHLFSLYNDLYLRAAEGSKAGVKKGRKAGNNQETEAEPEASAAGLKRSRTLDTFTPVQKLRPCFSAACLGYLCTAIVEDGLMQLPDNYDVSNPDYHSQVARETGFRACVLRNCAALLEDAQAAAASALLLRDNTVHCNVASQPLAGVLELGPALYQVAKLVMLTTQSGGRPVSKSSAHSTAGTCVDSRRTAHAAAAASADANETLEQLSATALLQLLKVAEATQQLSELFGKLPVVGQREGPALNDSSSSTARGDVAAAVMPHMPELLTCTTKLLQQGCLKEALVMLECLRLLGKHLVAVVPVDSSTDSKVQPQQQDKAHIQGDSEPAYAVLSRWAYEALMQEEPEVKNVPLIRALLDLYTRYHGKDAVDAVKITMQAINEVVGDTEGDTQATQDHGTILPMLIAARTAQPAALTPLSFINEGLEQLEKLAAANLKGGVFQDGDSAAVAKQRQVLAAAVCKRLQQLLACLKILTSTIIAMPMVIDQQTRVSTRSYKLLAILARAYQLPKRLPATSQQGVAEASAAAGWRLSPEFEALVSYVHRELTPSLNHALKDLGVEETTANLARVRKDAKLLPALVYSIEDWERKCLSTGKSASKNLLRDAKRSFCRDFKVKMTTAAGPSAQQHQAAAAGATRGRQPVKRSQSQQHQQGSRGSGGSHEGSGQAEGSSRAGSHCASEPRCEEDADEVQGEDEEMEDPAECGSEEDPDAEDAAAAGGDEEENLQPQYKADVDPTRVVGVMKIGHAARNPLHHRQA